jgi:hypothetical protein
MNQVAMAEDFKKVAHDRQLGSEELRHETIKKKGEPGYPSEYRSPTSTSSLSPTGGGGGGGSMLRTAFDDNFEWAKTIQSVIYICKNKMK